MPYIIQSRRKDIEVGDPPNTPGEVNYIISKLLNDYIELKGPRYEVFNEVIGVLECAKLEVYRKIVSRFEDRKCIENGEVYTCYSGKF